MDEQRKRIYKYRQRILDGVNCKELILDMIREQVNHYLSQLLQRDYGQESFAEFAENQLSVKLTANDLRGMSFEDAIHFATEESQRQAQTQIFDAIEENLPDDEDTSEWNWEAVAKFANNRWDLSLRDRDLKKSRSRSCGRNAA